MSDDGREYLSDEERQAREDKAQDEYLREWGERKGHCLFVFVALVVGSVALPVWVVMLC